MEPSPWEAVNRLTSQEIPNILWTPKMHYCFHKSVLLVSIPSQINPVHNTPSYFTKIYFNIIFPPKFLSFRLSHHNPLCIPLLSQVCYMLCPSQTAWLDHSNYTWRRVQAMKLLTVQLCPASRHLISLLSRYSTQHPVLKYPQSMFFPCMYVCIRGGPQN
jgi:hypothetical protein